MRQTTHILVARLEPVPARPDSPVTPGITHRIMEIVAEGTKRGGCLTWNQKSSKAYEQIPHGESVDESVNRAHLGKSHSRLKQTCITPQLIGEQKDGHIHGWFVPWNAVASPISVI